MGEQDVLAKALAGAADQAILHRGAGQVGADRLELRLGDGERHQSSACRQHVVAELPRDLITEAAGAEGRNRQAAGGDYQRLAAHRADAGVQQISLSMLLDRLDRGVQTQIHAGLRAFVQQHLEDVAGLVIAEQLTELLLVIGHAVTADHLDEVPLGVARQRRLAEVRVAGEEIRRLGVQIGEVAAAATGHEDFLAGLVGVVQQQDLAAPCSGGEGAH